MLSLQQIIRLRWMRSLGYQIPPFDSMTPFVADLWIKRGEQETGGLQRACRQQIINRVFNESVYAQQIARNAESIGISQELIERIFTIAETRKLRYFALIRA